MSRSPLTPSPRVRPGHASPLGCEKLRQHDLSHRRVFAIRRGDFYWLSLNECGYHDPPVGWPLLIVAGAFLWLGTAFLIDAFSRPRKRLSLLERLKPYHRKSVGEQTENWLREQ